MDEWARERIADWNSERFDGGVDGLHALADTEFTGILETDYLTIAMLNGRVIHHSGPPLEEIGNTGTVYYAPDPSVVLLFVMRESTSATEGEYYTEETPLRSVHETLEDGGFTGYIELSENVMSGDYFVVYYGGKALPVAFLGVSNRCVTGGEALKRASDEVGIYAVHSTTIDVTDLPPTPESTAAPAPTSDTTPEVEEETESDEEPREDDTVKEEENDPIEREASTTATQSTTEESERQQTTSTPEPTAPSEDAQATERDASHPPEPAWITDPSAGEMERETNPEPPQVRAVPSIDPESSSTELMQEPPQPQQHSPPNAKSLTQQQNQHEQVKPGDESPDKLEELETERDELKAERDRLKDRVAELEASLSDLEQQVTQSTLESEPQSTTKARDMGSTQALQETHIFVRYGSRSGPTLERVMKDEVDQDALRANLQLERHTVFDDDTSVVDGTPYEQFFNARLEWQFSKWLLETLPFEIAATDGGGALDELLEAITNVDRIDYFEPIEAADDYQFDIVARDQMGTPLLVADVDPGRSATIQTSVTDLIAAATEVGAQYGAFGGAFLVTESFFEPEVLQAVSEATTGSFLSRSDKASYVRVSRGSGYHLCLIEGRDDSFHMTTPSL